MAPAIQGQVSFNPHTGIQPLGGKVIFITGGTAGIGAETMRYLAAHRPAHIYFSGRNKESGNALVAEISKQFVGVGLTFIAMDLSSFASIASAVKAEFKHDRLDRLINNAGIMAQPFTLSKDGYEIQFATNHLGHAMLLKHLLPTLLKTAKLPNGDVRVVSLTSLGFRYHPSAGIDFERLESGSSLSYMGTGGWLRYGQSKLANILYASELARRYPQITSVSVHPGVVKTPLVNTQTWYNRMLIHASQFINGGLMKPSQGAWNTVWAVAAAEKEDLRNGTFYLPVGFDGWDNTLDKAAKDEKLASQLWEWTEEVLARY
ncbi:short-chain dehydrogenase/ reductase-like protein [Aaosphaeria arxii CBS 175.79]|uniref:Short-chain dehydrogenase/ reductase-like protein n=1 Tax=Aaosphaeria arxii CBS 175.79 TaxID=1450172 RepID=A0A6A5X614_9PLEO|nr:short-chain dehydrogenase/ reductase-like protein [Aaosphaeria arxii CBS 175.79]KAF2008393.1 short-chain dehydrogenase/ reductase-like protein [Aaosphaeria arxii CBS 175.79]